MWFKKKKEPRIEYIEIPLPYCEEILELYDKFMDRRKKGLSVKRQKFLIWNKIFADVPEAKDFYEKNSGFNFDLDVSQFQPRVKFTFNE